MRYTLDVRGEDRKTSDHEGFVRYERGGKRVVTEVIPVTWRHVLLVAFINALAIQSARICWFEGFGRPQIFTCHARLEMDLAALNGEPVLPMSEYCK